MITTAKKLRLRGSLGCLASTWMLCMRWRSRTLKFAQSAEVRRGVDYLYVFASRDEHPIQPGQYSRDNRMIEEQDDYYEKTCNNEEDKEWSANFPTVASRRKSLYISLGMEVHWYPFVARHLCEVPHY